MASSRTGTRRMARTALAAGASVALLAAVAPSALAQDRNDRGSSEFDLADQVEKQVSERKISKHLKALDAIGTRNDGTRASGTPGYEESVDYVMRELRESGYRPEKQQFDFPFFEENAPSELRRVEPTATDYETEVMTFSGSGDVTAAVTPVDLNLTSPVDTTSGCEPADFAGFPAGSIALIQRGFCPFGQKAINARDAGAGAVVIFNQGDAPTPDRQDVVAGTLGGEVSDTLPVVGASFATGQELAQPGTTANVVTDTTNEVRQTWNVTAETRGGDDDNVVMVGAHLDSVAVGPGVNDNGSGSATILETAKQLAKAAKKDRHRGALNNKVRFAWWGAEELGLLGSEHYVADLSADEVDDIALYLNFDMVGSPNYVRFVYDGDNSRFGEDEGAAIGPPGSGEIEQVFHDYFASSDLASEETPFSGRSDYGPFIAEGIDIPAGGLFTGAEGIKTAEQADIFGGEADVAYDVCYHAECDTIDNVSRDAIDEMSGAVAKVTGLFAVSTDPVNEQGPEFPKPDEVGVPVGTGTPGGGGLHDDHSTG